MSRVSHRLLLLVYDPVFRKRVKILVTKARGTFLQKFSMLLCLGVQQLLESMSQEFLETMSAPTSLYVLVQGRTLLVNHCIDRELTCVLLNVRLSMDY